MNDTKRAEQAREDALAQMRLHLDAGFRLEPVHRLLLLKANAQALRELGMSPPSIASLH